ncbi:MAG: DUF6298 domain-containing protein [Verrucomicrobiota bacterium]
MLYTVVTALASLDAFADPLWAPANSRYFLNAQGKAVYLSGWHTWNNFQELSAVSSLNFRDYLDRLSNDGANFFRLWNLESLQVTYLECPVGGWGDVSPLPFVRTGPGLANDGKLKFDLNRHNPFFFNRLSNRVAMASSQGIYVMAMLFEAIEPISGTNFHWSPYNAANNVNGGVTKGSDVFTLNEPGMVPIYDNYIRKFVDTLNGFDNVLFEPANEPQPYSSNFISHVIDTIHTYEATKPKQHPVIYSSFYSEANDLIFAADNADWIAPGATLKNREPDPYINAPKPWLMDTDHIWLPSTGGWQYVWKCFLRGYNYVHMDSGMLVCPEIGWALPDQKLRRATGDTVRFANRMDLLQTTPSATVSSTTYALYQAGQEYLVWQPAARSNFIVQTAAGLYEYEWFAPDPSTTVGRGSVRLNAGSTTFTPPATYPGGVVLYLHRVPKGGDLQRPRLLTIRSSDTIRPGSVVAEPPGTNGASKGTTEFTRTYADGMGVKLHVPRRIGTKTFLQWLRNGHPYDSASSTYVRMDTNQTVTPVYVEGLAAAQVPEAADYTLVYSVELPNRAQYNDPGVLYDVDTHGNLTRFSRIAYYLELQTPGGPPEYVWVSMDAFTQDATKIGVPTAPSGAFFQQAVTNMNVQSSVAGMVTGEGLAGGWLEFWAGNYGEPNQAAVPNASSSLYDWGDTVRPDDVGYGSMQVHNAAAGQTLFAFNGWGNIAGGHGIDLGIGNYSGTHPDWTFAQNASSYSAKTLEVYVLAD